MNTGSITGCYKEKQIVKEHKSEKCQQLNKNWD